MFIIPPYLRIALMAVLIIGGIVLSFTSGFWYGFPLWLAGLILLVGYVLLGTVASAAKAMQTQDIDKTERLLHLTPSPKLLYSANRGYYYMLKGSIAMSRQQYDEAEEHYRQAKEIKLPGANESAMLELQLAGIAANRQRWKQAEQHLRMAKQSKPTEQMIKDQIKQMEAGLKQRGQMKAATRMGRQGHQMMRQGKGKRRRPKMR